MNTVLNIPVLALVLGILFLVAVGVIITYFVMRAHQVKACNEYENQLIRTESELKAARELQEKEKEHFAQQLEMVRSQMAAETEQLLKQREEALTKKAEETFRNLAGPLGKDLKAMQESFDAQNAPTRKARQA